jgi:hypothetical protein
MMMMMMPAAPSPFARKATSNKQQRNATVNFSCGEQTHQQWTHVKKVKKSVPAQHPALFCLVAVVWSGGVNHQVDFNYNFST